MHDHSHDHQSDSSKNITIALLLNFGFAVIEIVLGLLFNSLAILSNSLHDFGDSFSLGLSWYFDRVSKRERTEEYTYGFARFSLIPVIVNSTILLIGSAFILYEAVLRLIHPEVTRGAGLIAFAVFGMLVNLIAYLRLRRGKTLNERAVSLHLLDDVLSLGAVLIVGIVLLFADIKILDPLLSIGITIYVVYNIFRNIRQASVIFLQGVPSHIDVGEVRAALERVDGVIAVHDVHVWTLDEATDVFTGHIVVEDKLLMNPDETKHTLQKVLRNLHIEHSTLELESQRYCTGNECD